MILSASHLISLPPHRFTYANHGYSRASRPGIDQPTSSSPHPIPPYPSTSASAQKYDMSPPPSSSSHPSSSHPTPPPPTRRLRMALVANHSTQRVQPILRNPRIPLLRARPRPPARYSQVGCMVPRGYVFLRFWLGVLLSGILLARE